LEVSGMKRIGSTRAPTPAGSATAPAGTTAACGSASRSPTARGTVAIEDIEELRRRAGIDDVELRESIRRLRVGDRVRLTILEGPKAGAGKTLWFRIIRVRGSRFRGRLAEGSGTAGLRPGALLSFTAAHIHSVAGGGRTDDE
jgi:hypothetical protein